MQQNLGNLRGINTACIIQGFWVESFEATALNHFWFFVLSKLRHPKIKMLMISNLDHAELGADPRSYSRSAHFSLTRQLLPTMQYKLK